MKRKLYLTVFILITILCLFSLSACKKTDKKEENDPLEARVSTYHDGVFVGANDDFSASFITGEGEKLIVIDGEVGERVPFATLTVTPLSADLFNHTYTYLLKGEQGERSGALVKDVIGASFSAEVENAAELGKALTLTVLAEGSIQSTISFIDKTEGILSWREILAISEEALRDLILAESDSGIPAREIYIKLVNVLADGDTPYYYYVSYIKSSSDYWALLIDPVTGEIVSKKV